MKFSDRFNQKEQQLKVRTKRSAGQGGGERTVLFKIY
jgi:hypothetical protein